MLSPFFLPFLCPTFSAQNVPSLPRLYPTHSSREISTVKSFKKSFYIFQVDMMCSFLANPHNACYLLYCLVALPCISYLSVHHLPDQRLLEADTFFFFWQTLLTLPPSSCLAHCLAHSRCTVHMFSVE